MSRTSNTRRSSTNPPTSQHPSHPSGGPPSHNNDNDNDNHHHHHHHHHHQRPSPPEQASREDSRYSDREASARSRAETAGELTASSASRGAGSHLAEESPTGANSAAEELQQGLLLLYRKQQVTDLGVKVGRAVFRCHRVVLCAVSSLFTRILTEDPDRRFVVLQNADAKVFEEVLEYIYTGRLVVGDNFEDFLNMIMKLEIAALANKMETFLVRNLTPLNCITIWKYAARMPDFSDLKKEAEKVVIQYFFHKDLVPQLECLTLPELVHFLEHKDLKVENEEMVVRKGLEWLNRSKVRGAEASGLFQRFYLPLTSKEFIRNEVETTSIVREDPNCQDMVTEAMTFLSRPERRHEYHSKSITYRKTNPRTEVLMVFGGYKLKSGRSQDTLAMDLASLAWHTLSPWPHHPGKGMATCVYDNNVYVSGGSSDPQAFWMYISEDDRWKQGPPLDNGRRLHCMEVLARGRVCVMGGVVEMEVEEEEDEEEEEKEEKKWEEEPQYRDEPVLEVETLGQGEREWSVAMELLLPVSEATSALSSDGLKIFVCGGKMTDSRATNSLQCLDFRTNTCTLLSHQLPVSCAGAVGLRTHTTYFLLTSKGEIMRLNPDTAELLSVEKVEHFSRRRFGLVCHHDRLLVIGGEDGPDMQKMMLCFHLDEPAVETVPWESFMPPVRSHFGLAKIVLPRRNLGESQW